MAHPQTTPREARKRGLKIGEVARRAGVAPSVVTYYLGEGLLPKPVEKSRNMARYDEETVDWIVLIRELQDTAFLPLKVIKKIVTSGATPAEIRESFAPRRPKLASAALETVDEQALLGRGALEKSDLRELERLEIVAPKRQNGRRVYSADDATIIAQLERMREAGLTRERGYRLDQLAIYRDAMEALVEKEMQLAIEGVAGSMTGGEVADVAKIWMESANEIIRALHNKLVKRAVRQLAEGMKGETGRSAGRPSGSSRKRRK